MRTSISARANLELIEENYRRWQRNPESVDSGWSAFFEGFELGNLPQRDGAAAAEAREAALQTRVDGLVYAYCSLGHTIARVDPLAETRPQNPLLSLHELGFSEADLDLRVSSKFFLDNRPMTLREMVSGLERIYADSIGSEFMHIQDPRVREWIRKRLETRPHKHSTPAAVQVALLRALLEAESFEIFLHTRYVGQKRFSLQGSESLMVILDTILHKCTEGGVEEICMGMAHRGRLNVLANFLRKSLKVIFTEFTENYVPELVAGDGDVKYHLGYHSVRKLASGGEVEIRLSSNPSHLEAVDPVVEGQARARQRIRGDTEHRRKVLPLLVHGDAAFIAQGIVAETLNLSQLHGYSTGGTIHIVVNNQIGFTTLPKDARSSTYSTDIAKMIEAPIFHVNGDDPLAVKFVSDMAFDFRQRFGRDVVIDMYCYRRYGHNEGDEPSFTQPDLYAKIEKRPSVTQLYKRELLEAGTLSEDDAASLETEFGLRLEMTRDEVDAIEKAEGQRESKVQRIDCDISTGIQQRIRADGDQREDAEDHCRWSYPRSGRLRGSAEDQAHRSGSSSAKSSRRAAPMSGITPKRLRLDHCFWMEFQFDCRARIARAALLAHGTRCCTTQRRANLTCRSCILPKNKRAFAFTTARSQKLPCSGSIMGTRSIIPKMLCLWEAQFGDFSNGAQTIIDQFIVSAESKWQRPSGIVLLLPHGYEGQGPEHSSARLERFLQALRRGQHPGLQSDHRRAVFSCAAASDEARLHQAADHHDAQESVASEVCFLAGGRIHPRPVRRNSRRT